MLFLIMIALYVLLTHDRSGGGFLPGSRQPRIYTYSRIGRHTYIRW